MKAAKKSKGKQQGPGLQQEAPGHQLMHKDADDEDEEHEPVCSMPCVSFCCPDL